MLALKKAFLVRYYVYSESRYTLFDLIIEFLDKIDPVLNNNLKQRKIVIRYLTDNFQKMNEVNLKLRGNNMNFI